MFWKIGITVLLLAACSGSESPDNQPGAPSRGESSTRLMILRGGGWEASGDLQVFESRLPPGYIALVLSATDHNASQGTQYFYDYYDARLNRTLKPIYTYAGANSGSQYHANSAAHAETLRLAAGVIITGGDPARLKHLVGTQLGKAIKETYERGAPLYAV